MCVAYAKPNMRCLHEASRKSFITANNPNKTCVQTRRTYDPGTTECYEPRPACPCVCSKSSPKASPKPNPTPARQGSEGDTGKGGSAPRVLGEVALGSILFKLTENFSSLTTCPL
jgi:hypothetical protein